MQRTIIAETVNKIDQEVILKGWVRIIRSHGKLVFLDLRDGSGMVQVVVNQQVSENAFKIASELHPEFVIEVMGLVKKRPQKTENKKLTTGSVEIEAKQINIIQKSEVLPFDMGGKDLNLEVPTLLDYRSLTLRHPHVAYIFRVQEKICEGFRRAAQDLGCVEVFIPTIVPSATEGGAELFDINYYLHKAYLAQSPQLYKQMLVPVFEKVYTIAHAYRAEPSVTTRHLSEVTQMDCEFGFVDFDILLDYLELVGTETLKYAQDQCREELETYGIQKVLFGKIPRLTLREVQEIIFKDFARDNRAEKDLTPQDEIDICKWAKEKHGSDFVTVTHFPTKAKAFYTMPDPKNPGYSLSYDLLFRGTEIMSGSQRINDYKQLSSAIKSRNMDPGKFEMYLQAFKYGMPPEGGFSFGLERLTMKFLGLKNIREASLFPRDMERVDERFSH
jgi:nondiscriminating aspartyl-tRNA synthetase